MAITLSTQTRLAVEGTCGSSHAHNALQLLKSRDDIDCDSADERIAGRARAGERVDSLLCDWRALLRCIDRTGRLLCLLLRCLRRACATFRPSIGIRALRTLRAARSRRAGP